MGDYLKQVEEQLVEMTERGAHRRPRPRLDALALVAAVVAVAAVAVAISTIGGNAPRHAAASLKHRSNATANTPHLPKPANTKTVSAGPNPMPPGLPPGGPVPRGFGPESFTAISELSWWLLGSAPCASPPCTSIVRTTDGGRTFRGIPAPRTQRVSQLRFADQRDGFAYGPGLWVTHDGGGQWNQVPLSGLGGNTGNLEVRELAASGGYVFAIVTNRSTGVGELMRSPVNADVWSALPAAGNAYAGLWVQGSEVLLEVSTQTGDQLRISHDGGQSFARYPVPPSVACQFEEPAPPTVWAHCATGMLSGVWRTVERAPAFTPADGGLPELPNSAAFGSASATTAVTGYRQLYHTTDGGASWSQVAGPTGITWWQYIGFTDPTHGVAIGYAGSQQPSNERLYYTTDGGASYHPVSIG